MKKIFGANVLKDCDVVDPLSNYLIHWLILIQLMTGELIDGELISLLTD